MNAADALTRPGPLAFMHVPKTAGTSVLDILRMNSATGRLALYYPPDHVDRPDGPIETVAGHIWCGYHQELGFDSARYFTFVRDPLTRAISHVYFEMKSYSHLLPDLEARGVRHAILVNKAWYYDNVFVRTFSGVHRKVPFGELGRDALDRARANIERHFFFIGEQEHFRADLRRLARILGWRLPGGAPRKVIGSYQGYRLSDDDLDFLREITRLDTELWHEIRASPFVRGRSTLVGRSQDRLEDMAIAARRRVREAWIGRMARTLLRRSVAIGPRGRARP
jgi:hypothetical protein